MPDNTIHSRDLMIKAQCIPWISPFLFSNRSRSRKERMHKHGTVVGRIDGRMGIRKAFAVFRGVEIGSDVSRKLCDGTSNQIVITLSQTFRLVYIFAALATLADIAWSITLRWVEIKISLCVRWPMFGEVLAKKSFLNRVLLIVYCKLIVIFMSEKPGTGFILNSPLRSRATPVFLRVPNFASLKGLLQNWCSTLILCAW